MILNYPSKILGISNIRKLHLLEQTITWLLYWACLMFKYKCTSYSAIIPLCVCVFSAYVFSTIVYDYETLRRCMEFYNLVNINVYCDGKFEMDNFVLSVMYWC